mmetsp:Transcript_20405/g.36549  ORF Transcript_20405/g.36549 Transcript_20405/m.36549 type:complete len:723 (+) Transcript_20405:26-2194(+)
MNALEVFFSAVPPLTLPKKVSIRNPKLNAIFYLAYMPIVGYAFYQIYQQRRYTTTISNDSTLQVNLADENILGSEGLSPIFVEGLEHHDWSEYCNFSGMVIDCMVDEVSRSECEAFLMLPPGFLDPAWFSQVNGSLYCSHVCAMPFEAGCWDAFAMIEVEASKIATVELSQIYYRRWYDWTTNFTMDAGTAVQLPAQNSQIQFEYFFKMSMAPPFFFGLNEMVVQNAGHRQARTVLTKNEGQDKLSVHKILDVGADIILPIKEIAYLAGKPFDTLTFLIGMETTGRVNCYTDSTDIPARVELPVDFFDTVDPSGKVPVCLIDFYVNQDQSIQFATISQESFYSNKAQTSSFSLSTAPGSSYHRIPDASQVFLYMISFLVLAGLPSKIAGFVALSCLGKLSAVYKRLTTQAFSLETEIRDSSIALYTAAREFQSAVDSEGKQNITKAAFQKILTEAIGAGNHDSLQDDRVDRLAEFCMSAGPTAASGSESQEEESDNPVREKNVDLSRFIDGMNSTRVLSTSLLDSLFDSNRKRSLLERLFTPSRVASYMHPKVVKSSGKSEELQKVAVVSSVHSFSARKSSRKSKAAAESGTVNSEEVKDLKLRTQMLEQQNEALLESNATLTTTVSDLREACLLCLEEMDKMKAARIAAPEQAQDGQPAAAETISSSDWRVQEEVESLRSMLNSMLTSQKALQAQQQSLQRLVQGVVAPLTSASPPTGTIV